MTDSHLADRVAALVRDVPDFPKPGILFKDITPLLADGATMRALVEDLAGRHRHAEIVAGIEARGFVLGAALAHELGVGFVPVRKAGKLPGDVVGRAYGLEYGTAEIEVPADTPARGRRVVLVDDLLATGGTAAAAWHLLESVGAHVVALEVVIELQELGGRAALGTRDVRAVLSV